LRNLGSTPDAVSRRCIFGAKQSTRRGSPAWKKTANRTVLCWSDMTNTEHDGLYKRELEIMLKNK